uniref:Armadillo repeat containing 2 n=1 Tax=Callorhinchus milii TaxID=7868 RepID=A0A4W3J1A6_CALMI
MQSSMTKKPIKAQNVFGGSTSHRKTSAEIISEARSSLRILKTQRPFTPKDDQRKLFGPTSSRTPENRPPSKSKILTPFPKDEGPPLPKPPLDPLEIKRVSNARARLFKAASQGSLPLDKVIHPKESKWLVPYILKNIDVEQLCKTCYLLHCTLEEGNMLGKMCKRRGILLKTLYKLVDIGSDQLSLQLAKLILSLKVSGKNLLNVCKLMFKVSRTENNDSLFQNDGILDCLLDVFSGPDPLGNIDALLYCMGTIKFLSGNMALLKNLLNKGLVETLVQLTKQINDANKESDTYFSSSGHLLVQVTATLRNLADLPQSRSRFLSTGALLELCVVLEQHINDKDVCTNVARIFSKLSVYNDCCCALSECSSCYQLFLVILQRHRKKQDIVVRVVFTLGNMTAKNNVAREEFYKLEHSVDTLLSVFQIYHELDIKAKSTLQKMQRKREMDECKNQKPSEVGDVLIKLMRVIANLSIHTEIGSALALNQDCMDLLIKVLECTSVDECEELMINAAATINNLSYYQVKNSAVGAKQLHIAECKLILLLCNNMDAILEAARVFGNISRSKEIRDFIVQKNVDRFMITLLDAKHQDVCFSACGVLINLTVDKSKRTILKQDGGIKKLIDCLRDFGPIDWQLASLVCKTLWNYSEKITSAVLCFGEKETNELLELLSAYLDEEIALDPAKSGTDEGLVEFHRACWESEFVPVAQQLLHRIQCHHTHLEALPFPTQ